MRSKPKRVEKATISGAITASLPLPLATMMLALSITHRPAAPPISTRASVKNTFAQKRFQTG